jgi:hypothetical protein
MISLACVLAPTVAIGAAAAGDAGGRSGTPVPTGQNRTFSDPINQPVPPATSTVRQTYPMRALRPPARSPQQAR